ncbi:hypothetical protein Leryth_021009 [Lithospermum erythrorhizon]|nr:hypothetical protein Leryth_021009 [Lithospermum erythrorhizon]
MAVCFFSSIMYEAGEFHLLIPFLDRHSPTGICYMFCSLTHNSNISLLFVKTCLIGIVYQSHYCIIYIFYISRSFNGICFGLMWLPCFHNLHNLDLQHFNFRFEVSMWQVFFNVQLKTRS